MTFQSVTPPAGALAGKTYGVDSLTGLLMITNPTIQDCHASRSIYIEYSIGSQANKMFLMGSSYSEFIRLLTYFGEVPMSATTPQQLATMMVSSRMCVVMGGGFLLGGNNGQVWTGGIDVAREGVAGVVSKVCAIPHRMIAGHWCTGQHDFGNMPARNSSSLLMNNETTTHYPSPNFYVPKVGGQYVGYGYSSASNPNAFIPTYVAATKSAISYEAALDKIVTSSKIPDERKALVKTTLRAALVAHGINMQSNVPIPMIVGGYNGSLRVLGDAIAMGMAETMSCGVRFQTSTGFRASQTSVAKTSNATYGAMTSLADGSRRLPLPLMGDLIVSNNVMTPYCVAQGHYATWGEASHPLTKTIDGINLSDIMGHQPFDCFYEDGDSKKVRNFAGNMTLSDKHQAILTLNRHVDTPNPQGGFVAVPGGPSVEAQMDAFGIDAANVETGYGDTASLGESYMVTIRTLLRLVFDSVEVSSDDITIPVANVRRVLLGVPPASVIAPF